MKNDEEEKGCVWFGINLCDYSGRFLSMGKWRVVVKEEGIVNVMGTFR